MGNSLGRRRKLGSSPSKKHNNGPHVVSFTSSSINNMIVEFPKEIEEDLERRKIESLKALAGGAKKTSTRGATAVSDPAHEMYEKVKNLDVPAAVPKPWSEVDQLLSKLKPGAEDPLTKKASPLPKPVKPQHLEALAHLPETIDMWELMDDLQDSDDTSPRKSLFDDSPTGFKPEEFTPKKVRPLESSLSFSTIHTVKEIESKAGKPETITSILKTRSYDPPKAQGRTPTSATTTPRKVIANVNPKLLARIEAFS